MRFPRGGRVEGGRGASTFFLRARIRVKLQTLIVDPFFHALELPAKSFEGCGGRTDHLCKNCQNSTIPSRIPRSSRTLEPSHKYQ